MNRHLHQAVYWTCLAGAVTILSACGGGGGGSTGKEPSGAAPAPPGVVPAPPAEPPPASNSPALRFVPEKVTATAEAGTSVTATVNATALRPQDFTSAVYALVVDSNGVILPNARVLAISATEYSAVLQTSPNLAPGTYKGSFSVRLCRDTACSSQFPGSPVDLPYEFTVTPPKASVLAAAAVTTLAANMHLSGPAPRQVAVAVDGGNQEWRATSSVTWARLGNNAATGKASFTVDFVPDGLAEGSYQGEITVRGADGQGVKLPVSLTVMANAFQTTSDGFTFNAVNGAPIAAQNISFSFDSQLAAPWTLASDSAWLGVNPLSGTTPGMATMTADAARGSLASGSYQANLTLSSPVGKDRKIAVQMNLTKPTLAVSAPALTFGGTYGREFTSAPLTLSLNTGRNAWPWTLGGMPAWAHASATSGAVSETGSALSFTPDQTLAPLGSTTVMLTAQAKVNGDTVTNGVALTINRDQRKLLPSLTGVALVSTPGGSRLTRTLTVSDNFDLGATWSAASDKTWLTLTRSGASLTLQADPATLPADTTSYATVTLTPTTSGVTAPETVRVALWKGSAAPAPLTKLAASYTKLAADPIRPLVYVHDGGASLDVYNVYTAQKTGTVALGAALGDMAVSQDGARLYTFDTANRAMVVLDLATLTKAATWPLVTAATPYSRLAAIRPNGVEVVLSNAGAYRASDGKFLSAAATYGVIAASQDGKRIFTQNEGTSPSSTYAAAVDYSAMGDGTLFMAGAGEGPWGIGSNGQDIATNADGSRVYLANGAPYKCGVLDGSLKEVGSLPGGEAYPNNVEVDSQGRVYCGISGWYSPADVWVHAANGALLGSYKFAGYARNLLPRQMAVSGDGMVLVGLTDDPVLAFVAVGP